MKQGVSFERDIRPHGAWQADDVNRFRTWSGDGMQP